jgi:hypothetical protein
MPKRAGIAGIAANSVLVAIGVASVTACTGFGDEKIAAHTARHGAAVALVGKRLVFVCTA